MRRAGALVGLASVAALQRVLFPAPAAVERVYVALVLALFAALLIGCAAVLLSPAHRAVARLATEAAREISAVPWRAAAQLRWAGFAVMVFYAAYVVGDVRKETPPAAAGKVNGLLPFLAFLAGVLTLNLSMLTGRAPVVAAAEEQLDGGDVNGMLPSSVRVDDSKV